MTEIKSETIELTEEDCLNIVKWWTATSMTVEAKLRTPFSDSEHDTIAKVMRTKEQLRHD